LDIGGANTKAAFVSTKGGVVEEIRTASEYFPVWKNPEKLGAMLSELAGKVAKSTSLDCVGVTMTAELSDAYRTKRDGVNHVLSQVSEVFHDTSILVLDVNAGLKLIEEARKEPLNVAAANWAATGWLVSRFVENCIVIDVGSTTTSIIPVVGGTVSAAGKTDLEKLVNGELVYTGSLRTNVAAIVNSVPMKAGVARVSSELFAQSGDVHLVLGNITEKEYTAETPDGRGKTRTDALARLARVVCADTEMLSQHETVQLAQYVCGKQVEQIAEELNQVYVQVKERANTEISAVVTGLGRNFLGRKAAQRVGIQQIIDLNDLVKAEIAPVATAVAIALMVANKLDGRITRWTR
jgi:probable H4MPT-linked C1 transfer pathway protein